MTFKTLFPVIMLVTLPATAAASIRLSLPATGSSEPAHTIFTCPAQDPSTSMNVSWATDTNVVQTFIEYTTADDSTWRYKRIALPAETRRSLTFDSINSKLADNSDVYERHVFNKQGTTLTGLKPDSDYRYRVVTRRNGVRAATKDRKFHTAGADTWRAAVIGDFHHYSPLWSRLDNAMAMLNTLDSVAGGVDWVLSTGDQTAWGASFNYWTELSEQPEYQQYIWASVEGNHDHWARDKDVRSDEFYRDTHFNPMNGYAGQEGIVYWFKWNNVLFIMLNNEAMRNQATLEKAIDWMRRVVSENPAQYTVVVEHYEWLIGTNGADSQLRRFAKVFDELGVDLAISGNNHVYLRTPPLYDGGIVEPGKGTYYVVNSSSDNSRGRDLKPLEANEDIIAERWSEGPKTVGGMILDVNPARIMLTMYDRFGNIIDTISSPGH